MKMRSVVLGLFLIFVSSQAQDCPLNWEENDGHCYKFVSYPPLMYQEAEAVCKGKGAYLLSVNSEAENNYIVQSLLSLDQIRDSGWWTSGTYIKDKDRNWVLKWEGDGSIQNTNDHWIKNDVINNPAIHVVYMFSASTINFGWKRIFGNIKSHYICEIAKSEIHRLIQDSRDASFGTTLTDPQEAEIGPFFVVQPQSLVVTERSYMASLECIATGNPQPVHQWFKLTGSKQLGQPIKPSATITITNGKMTFSNMSEIGTGDSYQCKASNRFGSILSDIVSVSYGYIREFSNVPPGPQFGRVYQDMKLNCNPPSFFPAATFQWQKDRKFLQPLMDKYYFVSGNGNLYISEVQPSDNGTYKCIVTLTSGPQATLATDQPESEISLGIPFNTTFNAAADYPPQIHNDFPAVFPQRPMRGQDIEIECFARGRMPLRYSWSRKDRPLPTGSYTRDLNRVLVIPNVGLDDEGSYICTVRGRTLVDHKAFTLTLGVRPYFVSPLRNLWGDIESRLSWSCEAIGQPRAVFSWYRNSTLLQPVPGRIDIQSNVLTISSLDPLQDNGMYQCAADNDYGLTFSSAQLSVMALKPSFAKAPLPVSMFASVMGNATIPCNPDAAPTPEIQWLRDGGQIASGSGVEILNNGYLHLFKIQPGSQGMYTCKATNKFGEATSSTKLTIIDQLVLTKQPKDKTEVEYNNTAFIQCEASYDYDRYDLVYRWNFNGHPIDLKYHTNYKVGTSEYIKGLYIRHANFYHTGTYECIAETTMSSVSASGDLEVLGPPGEPARVYVEKGTTTPHSVRLKWTRAPNHGPPVLYYGIEAMTAYDPVWRQIVSGIPDEKAIITGAATDNDKREWLVGGLKPFNDYKFRVRAWNNFAVAGDYSLASDSYNLPGAPPVVAPQNIVGGNGTVGTLTILWNPLPPESRGGKTIGYKVYWRQKGSTNDFVKKVLNNFKDGDNAQVVQVVGEDHYYLQYEVIVGSFNEFGDGPNSTKTLVYSAEGIPHNVPTNVNGNSYNASAIIVTWDPIPNTRVAMKGRVIGFEIGATDFNDANRKSVSTYVYGYRTSGIVIGLEPNSDYWVSVQVFNTGGESDPSERQKVSTYLSAPFNYPEYVNITSHGPDSVALKWRGVFTGLFEEMVLGYKIEYWPRSDYYLTYKTVTTDQATNGIIYGLEKNKVYCVRVLGYSRGGDGKKSPTQYFTLGGTVAMDPTATEIIAGSQQIFSSLVLILTSCLASIFIIV